MLHKSNRLAKDRDIGLALSRGRTFFNPFFTIKYLKGLKEKRFTVVVSTKVAKKAVTRNRIKRVIREYVRKNLSNFRHGDYVLIVKPKAAKLPEKDLLPNFLDACARLK